MHIYKFRMVSDENDNFLRDFEVQATQTFEDFHNIISECVNLNGNELASFHMCDQKWNKLQEITLIEMVDGQEEEEGTHPIEKPEVMRNAVIRDFIHEPSQRMLYEYDFLNLKTFYIELMSVYKQKEEAKYPRCVKKLGEVIEKFPVVDGIFDDEELRNQLLHDFENTLDDTLDMPPEYL